MLITYRDTNLDSHEINLVNAVDVRIGTLRVALNSEGNLLVRSDDGICVIPQAANTVLIKESE